MFYIDLIMNLALLVALSVLSGFIDKRWSRDTWTGVLLQGFLFGSVAILGMLRPLVMGPGLIFDGRSIVISLCALFFGHRAASVSAAMAAAYRLALGGPGVIMGVSVVLASAVIGILARNKMKPQIHPPSTFQLFLIGFFVHAAMVALMFTLPGEMAIKTIKQLGLSVITLYPLATILSGKILSDQVMGALNTKALTESEERYKRIFEDHSAVKLLIDLDTGKIIDVNEAAEKFYGWPRETLKEMKISDINILSPEEIKQEMEKARAKKKIHFEFRHRLADNSIRDVSVFSSKINIKGKEFLHSIIHDETMRKRAEMELQRLAEVVRLSSELVNLATLDGQMIFINEAGARMLGIDAAHLDQVNIMQVIPEHLREMVENELLPTLISGGMWEGDLQYNNLKTGELIDVHTITFAVKDQSTGEPALLANVSLDITERKRAEEEVRKLTIELEKRVSERTEELHKSQLALLNVVDDLNENAKILAVANESLAALNRELESFAYSVSHDLRAPLRSIDGFSAALLEDYSGKLEKTGKDYLQRVRHAAQNMGELIDNLLKLSRVSKADFRPVAVNLSKMAAETASACKKQNGRKNIKIEIQADLTAMADAALMQITLTNLIGNAFKFTGKKENTRIEFGARREGQLNIFFVRDNGAGFDMTYANKLFAPFQRLHNFDEFEGTGIGLATVQRIIHRHGGKVWAEGEVDKGATFFFTLPETRKDEGPFSDGK